jgi:hypothetical protein
MHFKTALTTHTQSYHCNKQDGNEPLDSCCKTRQLEHIVNIVNITSMVTFVPSGPHPVFCTPVELQHSKSNTEPSGSDSNLSLVPCAFFSSQAS